MQKNSSGFIQIILILVVVIIVAVFVIGKNKLGSVFTVGSPVPTTVSSSLKSFVGKVLPISFQYSSSLKVIENDQIEITLDYPDRPLRFMRVSVVKKVDISPLLELSVNGTYKDPVVTEQNDIATRLPDTGLGGKTARLIEWNMLWEVPGPVREYYVQKNESNYYKIQITYSNLNSSQSDLPSTFDYVKNFDQILSTFKFTN